MVSGNARIDTDRTGESPCSELGRLEDFLIGHRQVLVLSGAGCSTGSGIPDYRDGDGAWKRPPPMDIRRFLASDVGRQRYWARSLVGWSRVATAQPNAAHEAIATLERGGILGGVITQNVDGLHQQAGSRRVIDLHGRLDRVECLDCGGILGRAAYQLQLEAHNPGWAPGTTELAAPDGDADLGPVSYQAFTVPPCPGCRGVIRPSVVFFGENVPVARVQTAYQRLDAANALLVVGSSLMVWSGLRFVRRAVAAGKPVAAVNAGRTRAEADLVFRIEGGCGEILSGVADRLTSP